MPRIEWDDSLSVDNGEIDRQHKQWIEIHNRLHDVLMQGDSQKIETISAETLKDMLEYVKYHFRFEEEYMKNKQYPDLVEHRRLHRQFDEIIYSFNRDVKDGQIVLNSRIIKTIKNWFIDHIRKEDMKFGQFLKNTA